LVSDLLPGGCVHLGSRKQRHCLRCDSAAGAHGEGIGGGGHVVRHIRDNVEVPVTEGVVERLDVAAEALGCGLGGRLTGCPALRQQTSDFSFSWRGPDASPVARGRPPLLILAARIPAGMAPARRARTVRE